MASHNILGKEGEQMAVNWLQEKGYEIDRHRVHLREPIKRLGDYSVPVRLHRDVSIDLQVKVVPEGEMIAGHMTPEQEEEVARQTAGDDEADETSEDKEA